MRAWLMAAVMVTVVLSGCASSSGDEPTPTAAASIEAPTGAAVASTDESIVVEWKQIQLPLQHTFPIPEGVTMVRLSATQVEGPFNGVYMAQSETGRRRCNVQTVLGFSESISGHRECGSITALDPPGTKWTATVSGYSLQTDTYGIADVKLEFYTKPVDGPIAELDLSQLSHATYELQPTKYLYVNSHDGAPMWVEYTLPEGPGPWPTVIASSPYNGAGDSRGEMPAMWTYWTQDWAKRGYAAVNMDVRGFGMSGGCVEVWGENEQKDQDFIVDWVSKQPWSDGNVGFYGQSYVGTTPVAAAVQAHEALKAIIAVAPVINAYEDWHYGGVPNGESSGSPVGYQFLTAQPGLPPASHRTDLASILQHATSPICDPDLIVEANDPRAIYNDYYAERDFKLRADKVQAATLFTEGFEDANVKSAMIPGWFNAIQAPKLGVFGHWLHQHPARMDQEVLFLGWMDQYVKGRPVGFEKLPAAFVSVEPDLHRMTDSWPSQEAQERLLYADFDARSLAETGKGSHLVDLVAEPERFGVAVVNTQARLTMTLEEPLPIIAPSLHLKGTLAGENGFIHAELVEERADGTDRVLTWGRINLALRNGYDSYDPIVPGSVVEATLPFRPTEHVVAAGSTLALTIRGVEAGEAVGVAQPQPGTFELDGTGTYLIVPTVPMDAYTAMPTTAKP